MNEDLSNIQYSPVRNYDYSHWFEPIEHNGKTLSKEEKMEFAAFVDETISQFSSGLPLIHDTLDYCRNRHDEYHNIEYTFSSVMLFTILTSIDCMVASKYFVLADTDYDRRFMRGKMMIILNEGFKRLYGFDSTTRKKSEWNRLIPLLDHFPTVIRSQYSELTQRLDEHSKSSSWWRDERNLETHLEAEGLYKSRMEELIDSKVLMDNLKLFKTLRAVYEFLANAHACLFNFLVDKYKRGELVSE